MSIEDIKVTGLAEGLKMYERLPDEVLNQGVKNALRETGKVAIRAIRQSMDSMLVPRSGELKKSVHTYRIKGIDLKVESGLRVGFYQRRRVVKDESGKWNEMGMPPHVYAYILEHGWTTRAAWATANSQSGWYRGRRQRNDTWQNRGTGRHVPARPFVRSAFASSQMDMIETFKTALQPGIEKAIARARARFAL